MQSTGMFFFLQKLDRYDAYHFFLPILDIVILKVLFLHNNKSLL